MIHLSGYTEHQNLAIEQKYLVPRQLRENGLRAEETAFTEEAILEVIRDYTREEGVRTLERELGRAARKVVTKIAEGTQETDESQAASVWPIVVSPARVSTRWIDRTFGPPRR